MPAQGFPVLIVEEGGVPVNAVESNYPLMTVAENGKGLPITITPLGAPFVVEGYTAPDSLSQFALSSDDGSNLIDDDDQVMETYNGNTTA